MKTRHLFITIVLFLILTLGVAWAVQAQGGHPPRPPRAAAQEQPSTSPAPPFLHARGAWDAKDAPQSQDDLGLGQPGLSFRYVKTFGETRKGFLDDTTHFYEVRGLGLAGDDFWLVDTWGDRALKFDANGNFLHRFFVERTTKRKRKFAENSNTCHLKCIWFKRTKYYQAYDNILE